MPEKEDLSAIKEKFKLPYPLEDDDGSMDDWEENSAFIKFDISHKIKCFIDYYICDFFVPLLEAKLSYDKALDFQEPLKRDNDCKIHSTFAIDDYLVEKITGYDRLLIRHLENEAIDILETFKCNSGSQEYKNKQKIAINKLIKENNKTAMIIGIKNCFASIFPFVQHIICFRKLQLEQEKLAECNFNLLLKASFISNYPLLCNKNTYRLLYETVRYKEKDLLIKLFLRFIGGVPIIGQLFSLLFGIPICAYLNYKNANKYAKHLIEKFENDDIKELFVEKIPVKKDFSVPLNNQEKIINVDKTEVPCLWRKYSPPYYIED